MTSSRSELSLQSVKDWNCLSTARWLKKRGFPELTTSFLAMRIDGAMLLDLRAEEMEAMGIKDPSVRRKLSKNIDVLRRTRVERLGSWESSTSRNSTNVMPSKEKSADRLHLDLDCGTQATSGHEESWKGVASPSTAASPSPNGSRKRRPSWRPGGGSLDSRNMNRSASSMSMCSDVSSSADTGTTLPSIERRGYAASASSKGLNNRNSDHLLMRLKSLFHDESEFRELASASSHAKTTSKDSKEQTLQRIKEHRSSQTSLFGFKNEKCQTLSIGLFEWQQLLVREGIIPVHLSKKDGVHLYGKAVKMEAEKGGEMRRRGFQSGIRQVAKLINLPLTDLQMPHVSQKEKDMVTLKRDRGGEQLGLTSFCQEEQDVDTVESFLLAKERRDKQHELKDDEEEGKLVLNFLRSREERLRRVRMAHEADSTTVASIKDTLRRKMQALGLRPTSKFRM